MNEYAYMPNPLLNISSLPEFSHIRPEHITPALDLLLGQARQALQYIEQHTDETPTWDNTVLFLENVLDPLEQVWSLVGHLSAVNDTPAIRAAHADNLARMTEFFSELAQHAILYQRYQALAADTQTSSRLSPARQKILADTLRNFRLGGADLDHAHKAQLSQIHQQQAQLDKNFSEHLLDATDAYTYLATTLDELAGLPQHVIDTAWNTAQQHGKTGWQLTLHFPCYLPVMQYAENRTLRETLFRAYCTRASELGPQFANGNIEWDNTENIAEQLQLRQQEAELLGFNNYAELSLATKMADTPAQVKDFLDNLHQRVRPYAERDWQELKTFAKTVLQLDTLAPWDITYASEKLRQARYAFSKEEVRQYFPLPRVLEGLFYVVQRLFKIVIKADHTDTWHPDVHFFRVETMAGELLAYCYLDLYARSAKQSGAWMHSARHRKRLPNKQIQIPVAYLIGNFPAPIGEQPALLSHDDVITLFHEFGHGLHHMLTQVEDLGVSGINGVEWDAVELPSQMLENFCWDWQTLQASTAHIETGQPLPRDLFERMLAAKNFQKGLSTIRQLIFATFDIAIHSEPMPSFADKRQAGEYVLQRAQQINQSLSVTPHAEFSRWPHSFSHIFAGGYAAGYYSYKWAEVLSADVYQAFEDAAKLHDSSLDSQLGARYQQEILQVGGSRPAIESFRAFRGRDPEIDALLRQDGLINADESVCQHTS